MAVTASRLVPPDRSVAQRLAALQRANTIRARRAEMKRDLRAGRVHIVDLLLSPPEWLESATVFGVLLAVPKLGRVKVNVMLSRCRISPNKTMVGLSCRQREELAGLLGSRGNGMRKSDVGASS